MTPDVDRAAPGVTVGGIGYALPPRIVTNDELAAHLDTSDEWIRTRTGIRQRHLVDPGTATSDLAVQAGAMALASAGLDAVDLVVVATTTPDHRCPASAPAISHRLGLGPVPAFDLNAVCSGFVYGLAVAAGLLTASPAIGSALLIGADTFSAIVDPSDRATAILFGDGAGAVVLLAQPGAGTLLGIELGSDGSLEELIQVRSGGSRLPSSADPADGWFTMQGRAVYRNAVARMTHATRAVLSRVGWPAGELDWFVGHQANRRILESTASRLGIPSDRVLINLDRVGNTAAASIPIALAQAAAAGTLLAGDRIALAAFGGGATWGAAAMVWPRLVGAPGSDRPPAAGPGTARRGRPPARAEVPRPSDGNRRDTQPA